jgi:hypothetical protein
MTNKKGGPQLIIQPHGNSATLTVNEISASMLNRLKCGGWVACAIKSINELGFTLCFQKTN